MARVADSIPGCIVGGAIGDAAGSACEGLPMYLSSLNTCAAEWHLTDDTQMTLATCEALTESDPDPALIAHALLRWFRARRFTGLGGSTLKALRDLNAGAHWALAGRAGEQAAGNGAAMRIAPLAFCVDAYTSAGRQIIRDVCRITHHSDEAYMGALAIVLAIRAAMEGLVSLTDIAMHLPDSCVRDRLVLYAGLPPQRPLVETAEQYGSSGYVVESVPFALLAATRVKELGFADMLDQVVTAGGIRIPTHRLPARWLGRDWVCPTFRST